MPTSKFFSIWTNTIPFNDDIIIICFGFIHFTHSPQFTQHAQVLLIHTHTHNARRYRMRGKIDEQRNSIEMCLLIQIGEHTTNRHHHHHHDDGADNEEDGAIFCEMAPNRIHAPNTWTNEKYKWIIQVKRRLCYEGVVRPLGSVYACFELAVLFGSYTLLWTVRFLSPGRRRYWKKKRANSRFACANLLNS